MLKIRSLIGLLIKYILIIVIITIIGGTLAYWLYPVLLLDEHHTNRYFSNLGVALLGTFITYNFFLFLFTSLLNKYSLLNRGVLCLLFASILWAACLTSVYGIDIRAIILFTLSIGVANFFIPYLDNYLTKLLNLT
jgi:hypothetical protein